MIRCAIAFQNPGIALFHNVLTPTECKYLIEAAQDRLEPSTVLTPAEDAFGEVHEGRTSSGACFSRGATPEIEVIERRIAQLTNSPFENGEGLQVMRYEEGQHYLPHHDFFDIEKPGYEKYIGSAGQRVFSVIMYLNDDFQEGETEFPILRFVVPPIRGSALVFRNVGADNSRPDCSTLHGGRPPKKGTKYIATKWIRENAYWNT